jgi:hypothetical protein
MSLVKFREYLFYCPTRRTLPLCEWQPNMKMKNPDPETKCPYYQPSSQNTKIRTFFSAMKCHHDWVLGYDDFKGFEGSLGALLKDKYEEKAAKYVSTSTCTGTSSVFSF